MKTSFIRKKAILINSLKNFFYENRFCFLSLFGIFLLGFITGTFVAIKKCDFLSVDILEKFLIFKLLSNRIGCTSYIIRKILFVLLLGLFTYFLSKYKISIILFLIEIFLLSYYLGLLIATITILYGFSGILNSILVILPFEIIILTILIFYKVVLLRRRSYIYRCCFGTNDILRENIIFSIIMVLFILIEGVCINFISSTIIFVI